MEKHLHHPAVYRTLARRDFFHLGRRGSGSALDRFRARGGKHPPTDCRPSLAEAIAKLEYLTPARSRRHSGQGQSRCRAALAREAARGWTGSGDVVPDAVPDPAGNSVVEQPLSRALGNALDWNGLMRLADKHAVRFLHVCVCTNGADPFHMTLWEGVPLREIVWLARPKANVRRVYYQSYHPEDRAPFQASLPLARSSKPRRARCP